MQFTTKLGQKIWKGDPISDTELQVALDHFEALEAMLLRSGPEWHLARVEATREANKLRDYRDARRNGGRYRPAERGVFDINDRDGAYKVSIPEYEGGKVVTFERYESAVRNAYLEGRLSNGPADGQALLSETLQGVSDEVQRRWARGYPQEVVDDIVSNVLKPLIEKFKVKDTSTKA